MGARRHLVTPRVGGVHTIPLIFFSAVAVLIGCPESTPRMPLSAGVRLGPYEILSAIGAGGMGEVYRSRDTKLNRDVAVKVLPELFAKDPERLARFRREAQMLAALNHPNIAHIHGFEDSGGVHALVMELVDGPTLAERIAAGPIPLTETLAIARQIAEALDSAHPPAGVVGWRRTDGADQTQS
jgi:serine/threonine protein kinase